MAQAFKEVAHLRTNKQKFDEGYDRIFGKKEEKGEIVTTTVNDQLDYEWDTKAPSVIETREDKIHEMEKDLEWTLQSLYGACQLLEGQNADAESCHVAKELTIEVREMASKYKINLKD
jgi:hypothetical protein